MKNNGINFSAHIVSRKLYAEMKREYIALCKHLRIYGQWNLQDGELRKIQKCVLWLEDNDLPIFSAIGLFAHEKKFPKIREALGRWVSDNDRGVGYFLRNLGLSLFDEIRDYDEPPQTTCKVIMEWKEEYENERNE